MLSLYTLLFGGSSSSSSNNAFTGFDVRVSVYDPLMANVLCLDAVGAGDCGGQGGLIKYEDTPAGCGAGEIGFDLSYAQITNRGYWRARNIVEISVAYTYITTASLANANKIYVESNARFDTGQGEDNGLAYFYDGATLVMRVPVTGIGADSGGQFITIGSPLSGGGNPTVMPAYGVGTYVGARRYTGSILRRDRPDEKNPMSKVQLIGLQSRLKEANGTFTCTDPTIDCANAISTALFQFQSRWPYLQLSTANFAATGTTYTGTLSAAAVSDWIAQVLAEIPTGDLWIVRVGHDRTPRLVKLYSNSSNTYTYNRTFPRGVANFEPLGFQSQDEDCSNIYNSVLVIGDKDPTTNQPFQAIVQDSTSISIYGQIDARPVTKVGLKSTAACQAAATAMLNQSAIASASLKFRVYTRNPQSTVPNQPAGISQGDVIRGTDCVRVTRFDDTGSCKNYVPDSELAYTSGQTTLWTLGNGILTGPNGPGGVTAFISTTGTGSSIGSEFAHSRYIDVVPGQVWTLGGWIDASHVTAGTPQWAIYSTDSVTLYAAAPQTPGVTGRVTPIQWTVPNGVTQVVVLCDTHSCTVASGQIVAFAQPEFDKGKTSAAYTPNYGAPDVYGLVASVVTTLDPRGSQYQDVQFSAIEPDWNAAMAERANGLANALRSNQTQGAVVHAYCVNQKAFPITTSTLSLGVTTPSFLALFAAGSTPVTISGSFTLAASNTNWVWINPNGTFTVNQAPTPISGSILYAIFMTNASGVIGVTNKAPIGIPEVQTVVDSSGNGQQVDLRNAYEMPPTGAFAGYVACNPTSGGSGGISWEKSGVVNDLAKGPIVFQVTGRNGSTAQEFGVVFLCDTNGGVSDPTNGYLARVSSANNLELFKRTAGSYTLLGTLTNMNDPGVATDHLLTIIVWRVGSSTVIAAQYDNSQWLSYADTSSPRTTGYFGVRQGVVGAVTYLRDLTVSQGQAAMDALVSPSLRKNLLLNGNNWFGTGKIRPSGYGWQMQYNSGNVTSYGVYSINGASFNSLYVSGSTSPCGNSQDITVVAGKQYTYIALVNAAPNGQARLWIGDQGYTTAFNASPTVPLGYPGAFYGAAPTILPGSRTGSLSSNQWEVIYGTFTAPGNYSIARVLLENIGAASAGVYFQGVMVIEGNVLQDYVDQEPNLGYLLGSSPLNGQGSLLNVQGTPVLTWTTTTTSITINIPATTYTFTDTSTLAVSSATIPQTGLNPSTAYYWNVWFDVAAGVYKNAFYGTTAPTKAQIQTDCYSDGRIPIYGSLQIATPASGTTGGSGGGGSSGGGSSCPADYQLVLTKERGYVRADRVDIGEHFPNNGGWVRVNEAVKTRAPLWRYTLERNGVRKSYDVNDTHAVKGFDGKWIMIKDLKPNDVLPGRDGAFTVIDSQYIKHGHYIAFDVEGHEFEMDDVLVHNANTL